MRKLVPFLLVALFFLLPKPAEALVYKSVSEISFNRKDTLAYSSSYKTEAGYSVVPGRGETCAIDDEGLKCWTGPVRFQPRERPARVDESQWKMDVFIRNEGQEKMRHLKTYLYGNNENWKCVSSYIDQFRISGVKCLRRLATGKLQIKKFSQIKSILNFGDFAQDIFPSYEPHFCLSAELIREISQMFCWKIDPAGEFVNLSKLYQVRKPNAWDTTGYIQLKGCEKVDIYLLCAKGSPIFSATDESADWVLKSNSTSTEEWELNSFYSLNLPPDILDYEISGDNFCALVGRSVSDLAASLQCWNYKTLEHSIALSDSPNLSLRAGLIAIGSWGTPRGTGTYPYLTVAREDLAEGIIFEDFCFSENRAGILREICWVTNKENDRQEENHKFIETSADWQKIKSDNLDCRYSSLKQLILCAGNKVAMPLQFGINYRIQDVANAKVYGKFQMGCIEDNKTVTCWNNRGQKPVRTSWKSTVNDLVQQKLWKSNNDHAYSDFHPYDSEFCFLEADGQVFCWSTDDPETAPDYFDSLFSDEPPFRGHDLSAFLDLSFVTKISEEVVNGKTLICFFDGQKIKKKICGRFGHVDRGDPKEFQIETREILEPNISEFKNISSAGGVSCGHYAEIAECWFDGSESQETERDELFRKNLFRVLKKFKSPKSISFSNNLQVCILPSGESELVCSDTAAGRTNPTQLFWPAQSQLFHLNYLYTLFLDTQGLKVFRGYTSDYETTAEPQYRFFADSKILAIERKNKDEVCIIDELRGVQRKSCGNIQNRVLLYPFDLSPSEGINWTLTSVEILSPALDQFSEIYSAQDFSCGKFKENRFCWSKGETAISKELLLKLTDYAPFGPTAVAANSEMNCMAAGDSLLCDQGYKPLFKDIKFLFARPHSICVRDANGIQCWNKFGAAVYLDEFNLLNFEVALQKISLVSSPVKSKFYAQLGDYLSVTLAESNIKDIKEELELRAHIQNAVGTILKSTDSSIIVNEIGPQFEAGVLEANDLLAVYEVLPNSFSPIKSKAAIKMIQLSLNLSLEFYSIDEQKILSELLPILGLAYVAPGDATKVSNLILALDQKQTLLDQRKSSVKTEFLIRLIEQEREWLRENAK